ncbi:unnamed protein product [Parnassius apollo]|uniref:(apollo) hypothetical protein n=1 Tax=Parnassius apollo TaxID=110799 RepID=A0A8S3XD62_PARAO|nr:unnamed protein product [Parnassius apollo]CAG5013871.1 unnamed protein product [Parnassius apollo]
MACKKRKVDSECRLFKEEWAWKYFFTEYNGKPVCLICNEAVAVFKDFNLARHFNTKHAKTKYALMNDAEKKVNAENLKKTISGQRNMFIKKNTAQKASTLAGYVVAYNIAKNNKPYSEGEFVKDCMDVLCKAALDFTHVLNVVIKLINTIRSRGLVHRQFQEFLIAIDADYSDLLYHTKVRWLSCGYAFERIWNLKEEIQDFLKNKTDKWSDFQIFENKDWCTDFAFFTDLLEHYNKLNKKLQGQNQFIDETWGCLKSFKTQLFLFYNCMAKNDLTHFPRLKSMAPVSENKLNEFSQALKNLHTEFETRFQDFKNIQSSLDVFSMPFNVDPENISAELQLEIIEMQCSTHLKQLFLNSTKLDFYRTLPKAEFPKIIAHAQKIMAMFASSYVCEQTFSTMKLRKNSIRNRLTDEHLFALLKVTSSQLEPAFENIMANQKQFHMSHTPTTAGPSNKS